MIDPFTAWSRLASAGLDFQSTWWRGLETLQASSTVIGARTELMAAAAAAPWNGNYAELSRMVPEKVAAFSQSVQAVTRDLAAMHLAWIQQIQRMGTAMIAGGMPSAAEASKLATQSAEFALGAMTAGARLGKGALAPVHRTATGNARRLTRARTR